MGAAKKLAYDYVTIEKYFELEKKSKDIRYEYYDGQVVAMSGTKLNHNELVMNFAMPLRAKFKPKGCRVFSESVKLEAVKHFYYPYPDIMLTCDKEDLNSKLIVKNPTLIIEVLSKSTAERDRSDKLKIYQKIPSVIYYVLVSQYSRQVELYSRVNESDEWLYKLYEKPEETLKFPRIDFEILLSEIYDNIIIKEENSFNPDSETHES